MSYARSSVTDSLLIGATLGTAESVRVLMTLPNFSVEDSAALLLYGWLSYAFATAAVATCRLVSRSAWPSRKPTLRQTKAAGRASPAEDGDRPRRMAQAVGTAVGTFTSLQFVAALVRIGDTQLSWLIPACVLIGVPCGMLAQWLALRLGILCNLRFWLLSSGLLLATGLGFSSFADAGEPLAPCPLVLSTIPAVLLLVSGFRKQPAARTRGFALANACLLLVIAAMPFANAALGRLSRAAEPQGERTNVLLISVDTLRRDRLGCYGYKGARTPHIDALARTAAVFDDATSPIPMTGPSHTTMLTGLYPVHHGAIWNGHPLRDGVVTVADVLAKAGYATAAFVSGWTLKDFATGLAGRFGYYADDFARWRAMPDAVLRLAPVQVAAKTVFLLTGHRLDQLERRGTKTTARALAWLADHRDRPCFLLVHYYDAHRPYAPPPPYDTMHDPNYRGTATSFLLDPRYHSVAARRKILSNPREVKHLEALYEGEISYADAEVGHLLDGLDALGLAKNTIVIFTADHGESLTEHNFYFDHAEYLYDPTIRVPLMVRFPTSEYAGTRWAGQVRLIDLTPTILDLLDIDSGLVFDGKSLLPILRGAETSGRASFGALRAEPKEPRSRYYVRANGYKLIWNFDERERFSDRPAMEELYDLTADPGELRNLIADAPSVLKPLRNQLREWIREKAAPAPPPPESVKERLRALGY